MSGSREVDRITNSITPYHCLRMEYGRGKGIWPRWICAIYIYANCTAHNHFNAIRHLKTHYCLLLVNNNILTSWHVRNIKYYALGGAVLNEHERCRHRRIVWWEGRCARELLWWCGMSWWCLCVSCLCDTDISYEWQLNAQVRFSPCPKWHV